MPLRLDEPLGIDPCVDVVFLRLFGGEHERIRIAFLNAVLAPEAPIRSARVLNTVLPPEFDGQSSIRVDLLVEDERGRTFQIEMQRQLHRGLAERMLAYWARLFASQLGTSTKYHELRGVISIWICEAAPFPQSDRPHLHFTVREELENFRLHDHMQFHVIQLSRFAAAGAEFVDSDLGAWCQLLREASAWTEVPAKIHTPVLEEAMNVLNEFRTTTNLNQLYRGRLEFERERRAVAEELEETRAEREAERVAKEEAITAKDAAEAQAAAERARAEAEQARAEGLAAELEALKRSRR